MQFTFSLFYFNVLLLPSPRANKHWKVFEDDKQIKQFLEMIDEFFETHIDKENQNDPTWIMQEGEDPENVPG
jgi:hypothetical protein